MRKRFQSHRLSACIEAGASSSGPRILRRTLSSLAAAVAAVIVAGCDPGPNTAAEGEDPTEESYAQNAESRTDDFDPGASTYAQTNRDQTATNMAGAPGQVRPSETQAPLLKQRIEERLTDESNGANPTLTDQEMQQVNITVNEGTVTLAGTVEDEQTKQQIEQETKEIPGVEMVNNQLKIASR